MAALPEDGADVIRTLLVALVVIVLFCPTSSAQQEIDAREYHYGNGEADHQPAYRLILLLPALNEGTTHENDAAASKEAQEPNDPGAWSIYEIAGVVISVIAVIISAWALSVSRTANKLSSTANQLVREQMRPYLARVNVQPSFVCKSKLGHVHVKFLLKNTGNTPARKIYQVQPSGFIIDEPQMTGAVPRPKGAQDEGSIGKGAAFPFHLFLKPPSEADTGVLHYLHGWVLYQDEFAKERYYEYIMAANVAAGGAGEYLHITHHWMKEGGN